MTNEERYKEALEQIAATDTFSGYSATQNIAVAALNPPPQFEEVPVVRWECQGCGVIYSKEIKSGVCCEGYNLVKLTGTYKREVKPKVRRREELQIHSNNGIFIKLVRNDALFRGQKNIRFYAEWLEEG
jgi:hypothetical protein